MPNSNQLYGIVREDRTILVARLSKKTEKLYRTYTLFPIIIRRITHWITTTCLMTLFFSFLFSLTLIICYRKREILLSIVFECTINCSRSIDAMTRNRITARWRVHNYWNLFNNNGNVETGNWVDKPGTYPCNKHSRRLFHRCLRSRRTLPCWKQIFLTFRWKWNSFSLI